jgi:lysophospholipase L1-like esterase
MPRVRRLAARVPLRAVAIAAALTLGRGGAGFAQPLPMPGASKPSTASAGAALAEPLPWGEAELPAAQRRWRESMAAFAAADRAQAPGQGGVLFVGSSTIRMWSQLAQDFRQMPVVINRGFGGSTMADCNYFARQLVTQYKPRQVLVYAGDNDLAEGRSPAQVLQSFEEFVRHVRAELPDARISYISIKPSPSRASLMPKVRETNTLIAAHVRTMANAEYIDIFTPMLAEDGKARADLYGADMLHMNTAGYALWRGVIAAHLPASIPEPAGVQPLAAQSPDRAAPRQHAVLSPGQGGGATAAPVAVPAAAVRAISTRD